MKAVIPVTLALASAASACTFVFHTAKTDENQLCFFEVHMNDDLDMAKVAQGQQETDTAFTVNVDCKKEGCVKKKTEELGHEYEFCLNGKTDDDGKVDGDITIQRTDGGDLVNLKADDGGEYADDQTVMYWMSNVKCEDAKGYEPEPTGIKRA